MKTMIKFLPQSIKVQPIIFITFIGSRLINKSKLKKKKRLKKLRLNKVLKVKLLLKGARAKEIIEKIQI